MRTFGYQRVHSIAEALASRQAADGSEYLAGGTTLIDLTKLDVMRPAGMIDINRLPLSAIETQPDGSLRIGANVRNSDLARHEEVRTRYPVLSEALLSGASPQLRNMATTAGNLMQRTRCPYFRDGISACNKREPGTGCAARDGYNHMHAILGGSDACVAVHPSDFCVALAILDAVIEVEGPGGRRTIAFRDFHLLPESHPEREHGLSRGELIIAVTLPAPPAGARSHYLKRRQRESFEFALASAAVLIVLDGSRIREARVALGGVGTRPWRSSEAEQVLSGAAANEESFRRAADATLSAAEPLTHNRYKIPLARGVLMRAFETAARPG